MENENDTGTAPEIAALTAEANAALSSAPDEPAAATATGEPAAAEVVDGEPWEPFLQHGVRPILFGALLPQWNVTAEEQDEWTKALAACCDQLFPGGPAGKYACYVRLAFMTATIAGTRALAHGGKLPPLGPKGLTHQPANAAA